eukprot:TRINITY_DN27291_c0_g2_i1.p1 TRINITY_DN27291_c0_g2~~TRINITY_DN27291_c0_g2_i1.p1  ORF type:complete len:327 (+),score=80.78 TRINITY_DN27291_c0_g2_i1:90-1070(+)
MKRATPEPADGTGNPSSEEKHQTSGGGSGGSPPAKVARSSADEDKRRAAAEAQAETEAHAEEAAFAKVWKNKVACLSALCKFAQRIERVWEAEDGVLRQALLAAFSRCLASLSTHKDKAVQELSSLAPKIGPSSNLRHFMTIALPIERQHTRGLRDHEFLVTRPDDLRKREGLATTTSATSTAEPTKADGAEGMAGSSSDKARMPLTVIMDNLRSAFNVGSVFRTSECLRVEKLHLCGYTATPDESKGQTGRAAMGAEADVPWEHAAKAVDVVKKLREAGIPVYMNWTSRRPARSSWATSATASRPTSWPSARRLFGYLAMESRIL